MVAFVVEDRSENTCQCLWEQIPNSYRQSATFSDFWDAYKNVFPEATHSRVEKETGMTAHVERRNLTLRQRLARFVRKTLSCDLYHEVVLSLFIHRYKRNIKLPISHF